MLECFGHIFSAPFTQTIDHFLQCLSALCQGILRLWRHHRIYFAVNQDESNSLHPADHVIPFCQAHDIVVQAWGPLGQGQGGLFTNPIVTQISGKHHKTPAQILLRFCLQKGIGIISKSVHLERMKQNLDILDLSLSETEMKQISSLQTKGASFLHSPDFVQMLCSKWHAAR